jgi:hypothetical protein
MPKDKADRLPKDDGGRVLHRPGCQCAACELIRQGDIKRTNEARTK